MNSFLASLLILLSEELGRTDVVKNKMYTDSIPPRCQPRQMMPRERTGPLSEASLQNVFILVCGDFTK